MNALLSLTLIAIIFAIIMIILKKTVMEMLSSRL